MSWLIRRNGRTVPVPWGDQARHKEGGGEGGAGGTGTGPEGGEPGPTEGKSGSGGIGGHGGGPAGPGGMGGFGAGRDIFGGTNPALMGSAEQAISPKGWGSSAAKAASGQTLTLGERIAAMGEKALLGGITMGMPGGSLAMGGFGKQGGGGGFPAGSGQPAGSSGRGDTGGLGTQTAGGGGPSGSISAPALTSGTAPPTARPTSVLAQHLANQDPTQLATALGGNAVDAGESAKELAMRLKLFQLALARASRLQQPRTA